MAEEEWDEIVPLDEAAVAEESRFDFEGLSDTAKTLNSDLETSSLFDWGILPYLLATFVVIVLVTPGGLQEVKGWFSVLAHLGSWFMKRAPKISADEGPSVVITKLGVKLNEQEYVVDGLRALLELSDGSDGRPRKKAGSPEVQAKLVRLGVCPLLVQILERWVEDPTLTVRALTIIKRLIHLENAKAVFLAPSESGAVAAVLAAMQAALGQDSQAGQKGGQAGEAGNDRRSQRAAEVQVRPVIDRVWRTIMLLYCPVLLVKPLTSK